MANIECYNWNYSAVSRPHEVLRQRSPEVLLTIVKSDREKLRAAGHFHSMNECFATSGSQILLNGLRIPELRAAGLPGAKVDLEGKRVVVEAGLSLLDIREALLPYGMQLPVMPEIGNATAGSLACCGTKDSSVGTGPGQVSSAVEAVKMVNAKGEIENIDVRKGAKERMREIRSSYGLLGIIYEVTFAIEPLVVFRHKYEVMNLLPLPPLKDVRKKADAVLGFMQPYTKQLLVERRFKTDRRPADISKSDRTPAAPTA